MAIYCCLPDLSPLLAIRLTNFQMMAIQIRVFQMISSLFRNPDRDRDKANHFRNESNNLFSAFRNN